jgi:predicted ABC-type ATPase
MLRFCSLLGGLTFLAAVTFAVAAGSQPEHAAALAEQEFSRSLPNTEAGDALQKRLGDAQLTGVDKEIEREAFELLARDEGGLIDKYISLYGKNVNTDDARELFPAYQADRSRAAAVHGPSTELSNKVYAKLLEENRGTVDEVIFVAGGGGSGKTTALKKMVLDQGADDVITFDGTFANPSANQERIKQALDNGYEVSVVYIHVENPLKALANALDRAERMAAEKGSGRTIPTAQLIEQHAKARQAFVNAAKEMKSDPRATFQIIDNSGALDHIKLVGSGDDAVDFMQQRLYDTNAVERLKKEGEELVETWFRAGKISSRTYRGFSGRVPEDERSDSRNIPEEAQEGGVQAGPSAGESAQARN